MATIKCVIRKNKINSKGECLIYLRYIHRERSSDFSSGIKVNPEHWNATKGIINSVKSISKNKGNQDLIVAQSKLDTQNNHHLQFQSVEIMNIVRDLQREGIEPDTFIVKKRYTNIESTSTVAVDLSSKQIIPLFSEFIRLSGRSTQTKKNYGTALYHVQEFEKYKKKKVRVCDLTMSFWDQFADFLRNSIARNKNKKDIGLSDNSVSSSVTNVKVFAKYLKDRGYAISLEFLSFSVPSRIPPIYFLTESEIMQLYNFDFSQNKRLERVRDLFVCNCYLGLRVSDLSRLRESHIKNGAVDLKALKNLKDVFAPLTPISNEILNKYSYVLPTLSEVKYNKYIKEACQIAGISRETETIEFRAGNKIYKYVPKHEIITSHIAIKSFITMSAKKHIPANIIAKITGKTVKTINKSYYGNEQDTITSEMGRAYGYLN